MNNPLFLETANKIGARICKQAIWQGNKCTWKIKEPDRTNPKLKIAHNQIAGGAIYQGVAGINLFLSELYNQTGDKNILKVIEGAAKYANNSANQLPNNSFGFHSGRVGIAYSSLKAGLVLQNEDFINQSKEILFPLKRNESKDRGIDVIGGAAGAIPILLKIYEELKEDWIAEMAINLGEFLINSANMETTGWSWGGSNTNIRNLCGYAHGAAGIGHAFFELFSFTGSKYFLYPAEQAFYYEEQFYNEEENNWPDFRYSELSNYIYYDQVNELRKLLQAGGSIKPYVKNYMSAWCHGAPGIGLSRLRAYEITGDEIYKIEANKCIKNTLDTMSMRGNYSLCHGIFGNLELIHNAGILLENGSYQTITNEIVSAANDEYENNNAIWPCGTVGGANDPSLMLGEAGIGYTFLRIHDHNIDSIICPTNNSKMKDERFELKNYADLQEKHLEKYFKRTIKLLGDVKFSEGSIFNIATAKEKLHSKVYDFDISIQDVFDLECSEYDLYQNNTDHSLDYIYELRKKDSNSLDWQNDKFRLRENVKIFEIKWDRSNFEITESLNKPDNSEKKYLLARLSGNNIIEHPITTLTYFMLKSIQSDFLSMEEILTNLEGLYEIESVVEMEKIKKFVCKQLKNAHDSNIVEVR